MANNNPLEITSKEPEIFYHDFDCEIKSVEEKSDGTFEGYGSAYGGRADSHGDVIVEGAFDESIRKGGRNRTGVVMLAHHDWKMIAGVWLDIKSKNGKLWNKGLFATNTSLGHDLYELSKIGAIKHESIGYDLPRDKTGRVLSSAYEIDNEKKIRYLKTIELWEISIVAFPAQRRARLTQVKSIKEATTVRELERSLREAGLSNSEAKYIVSLCRPSLREAEIPDEEKDEVEKLLDVLKQHKLSTLNL